MKPSIRSIVIGAAAAALSLSTAACGSSAGSLAGPSSLSRSSSETRESAGGTSSPSTTSSHASFTGQPAPGPTIEPGPGCQSISALNLKVSSSARKGAVLVTASYEYDGSTKLLCSTPPDWQLEPEAKFDLSQDGFSALLPYAPGWYVVIATAPNGVASKIEVNIPTRG